MKKLRTYTLLAFILSTGLTSCSLFNAMDYVPPKDGKYPAFTESKKLLGALTHFRSCYDVKYYNLDLKIDYDAATVGGTVLIASEAVNDFDTLQLDLYEDMNLRSVSFEAKELTYKRVEGAVFVIMPRRISAGEKFNLTIKYEGDPEQASRPPWDGGLVWKRDKNKNPWIGVACETEGASLWFPCKDHNSDEADSVTISVSVKKGLMAVCNGVLKDSVDLNDGWEKFTWFVSYPINTYNITFYVGKFRLIQDTYTGISGKQLSLNYYVLPENYYKAKKHFEQVNDVLRFYEKTFGEYPWYNDGYKLVESPYEGMEHQTAIAYGSSFKNTFWDDFDYILVHETAHEWWGNAITAADFADVWLQEGFATYSEALYMEHKSGKNAYTNYLKLYREQNKNLRPMVGPVGVRYFDYHDEDVYTKGAGTLQTLRSVINNDSMFFRLLKAYFSRYKLQEITSKEFISAVNEVTGEDYNWFFNQYLYNRMIPTLEYYWSPSGEFNYHWTNCAGDFKMQVSIDCGEDEIQVLDPSTTWQKKTLCQSSSFEGYELDVDDKLYKLLEVKMMK